MGALLYSLTSLGHEVLSKHAEDPLRLGSHEQIKLRITHLDLGNGKVKELEAWWLGSPDLSLKIMLCGQKNYHARCVYIDENRVSESYGTRPFGGFGGSPTLRIEATAIKDALHEFIENLDRDDEYESGYSLYFKLIEDDFGYPHDEQIGNGVLVDLASLRQRHKQSLVIRDSDESKLGYTGVEVGFDLSVVTKKNFRTATIWTNVKSKN